MNTSPRLLACTTLMFGVAAMPLLAQERNDRGTNKPGDQVRAQDPMGSNWVTTDKVIGANVVLQPAAAGEQPTDGAARTTTDKKGEVEDLIIDSASGEVCYAVISTGDWFDDEKNIAVPFDQLSYRPMGQGEDPQFALTLPLERVRSLPKFDLDGSRKNGLETVVQGLKQTWKDVRRGVNEATGDKDRRPTTDGTTGRNDTGTTDSAVAAGKMGVHYTYATKLKGMDVKAGSGEDTGFGDVSTVIVNPNKGCVDFVVASKGGVLGIGETDYLIPFGAAHIAKIADEDETVLQVNRSKTQMESAIKYKKPDREGVVLDPTLARQAYDFYGVNKNKSGSTSDHDRK